MFARLSLQKRLLGGFAAVVLVFIALNAYTVTQMAQTNADVDDVYDRLQQLDAAHASRGAVLEQNRAALRSVALDDPTVVADLRAQQAELREEYDRALGTLASLAHDGEGEQLTEEWDRVARNATDVFDHLLVLAEQGRIDDARDVILTEAIPAMEAMDVAVATLLERYTQFARNAHASAEANYADTRTFAIASAALATLAAALLGYLLSRSVSRRVSRSGQHLSRSSDDLAAVSAQMGANAEETATQANVVAAAGEQVSTSVQTVASAVEEMNASVREIARSSSEASEVAGEAVRTAEVTNRNVAKLGDSSARIGKVLDVITSIAEQTNLLALNATIEAARAGEAGKGFAVVANEVKELAKGTARATEEISERITAIQEDSDEAVTAIEGIGEIIARIADMQTTIASAVEQQTSTTAEISRSVNEAARGSAEIAANIVSVAQAARDTSEGATRTQQAAGELADVADGLRAIVGGTRGDGTQPLAVLDAAGTDGGAGLVPAAAGGWRA